MFFKIFFLFICLLECISGQILSDNKFNKIIGQKSDDLVSGESLLERCGQIAKDFLGLAAFIDSGGN